MTSRRNVAITIWVTEETRDIFRRKYYETKIRNKEIETTEDFLLYLMGSLIKEY
ncbi:MAG: hypothetical protein ACP5RE_03720 [Candidatus Acidifodinimicrobium sp.]